jgi:hypothetical protein
MEAVFPQGNIMIVDDNPFNLTLLEDMFPSVGAANRDPSGIQLTV